MVQQRLEIKLIVRPSVQSICQKKHYLSILQYQPNQVALSNPNLLEPFDDTNFGGGVLFENQKSIPPLRRRSTKSKFNIIKL